MIRILFIGRDARRWENELNAQANERLETASARLPASGIRDLEQIPPDLVILVDEMSSSKPLTLVEAIRERPLGSLTPIVLICPDDVSDMRREELSIDAWLNERATIGDLVATLRDLVGPDIWDEEPEKATDEVARHPAPESGADYILEELPEEDGPVRLRADEVFRNRRAPSEQEQPDEEELKRVLRSVRHEDYFTILGVPRGAQPSIIREAYHRKSERWSDQSLDFDLTHRFHEELAEVRDALEDAWAVLGDPKLREAYLRETTR